MTEYKSNQVKITKPDSLVYDSLSRFDNFTPLLKDKVEQWEADSDSCSFKAKGFTIKLRMIEKEPNSLIKIIGEDMPFEACFWIQLKSVDTNDTRMRLTVKAELNTMMKMMIGKKLQKGLDDMADQIAMGFNTH